MTLNLMDVDIMSLIKQAAFEMSDKLEEARLERHPSPKVNAIW